ncbi:hypothetical protein LC040_02700 [Bacillus tianshenii]|nr:hypothetical protein LC040_02700 [Bacillus tianshenii]
MKSHTTPGKVLFWLGVIIFIGGIIPLAGLESLRNLKIYVPNQQQALTFVAIGATLIFIANFFRKRQ